MTGGSRRAALDIRTLRTAEGTTLVVAVLAAALDQPAVGAVALMAGALAGAAAQLRGVDALPELDVAGVVLRGLVAVWIVAGAASSPVLAVVAATVGLLSSATLLVDAVDQRIRGLRRHPATRGVPGVGSVPLVVRPPALLAAAAPECVLYAGLPAVADRPVLATVGAVTALAVCVAVLGRWALRLRAARRRSGAVLAGMRGYLMTTRPEVLLYAGDGPAALHEIMVWLPTMERLSTRVVLLMRNRDAFAALPPTTLPVLCVPGAPDLLALPLHEARAAMFVSNIGNNIHLLRVPGLRSVFIGHGDSDKSASANPYAKVYDEIWVAGPAGRDRYLRADVGVRPDALVEVGRPQVEGIHRGPLHLPVRTLLYAPTWEGWNDDQNYSSLVSHGAALVRAVLASPAPVRLVYRPHPYTGRRSRAVAAAHREILEMLDTANEAAGTGPAVPLPPPRPARFREASAAADEDALVRSGQEWLAAQHPRAHVVVGAGSVPLVSNFAAADGLVTDVSSVLSDFLVTDRPVAVCDPAGLPAEHFLTRFPSAAGALVLPPRDEEALERMVGIVAGRAPDPAAQRRSALRRHVLGPDSPSPLDRFDAAVAALTAPARDGAVPTAGPPDGW